MRYVTLRSVFKRAGSSFINATTSNRGERSTTDAGRRLSLSSWKTSPQTLSGPSRTFVIRAHSLLASYLTSAICSHSLVITSYHRHFSAIPLYHIAATYRRSISCLVLLAQLFRFNPTFQAQSLCRGLVYRRRPPLRRLLFRSLSTGGRRFNRGQCAWQQRWPLTGKLGPSSRYCGPLRAH